MNDLTRNTTDATISPANTTSEVRLNIQLEFEYPHIDTGSAPLVPVEQRNRFEGDYRDVASLADAKLSVMLQRSAWFQTPDRQKTGVPLAQPVLLHPVQERGPRDAEQPRGL